jgi:TonB family protein
MKAGSILTAVVGLWAIAAAGSVGAEDFYIRVELSVGSNAALEELSPEPVVTISPRSLFVGPELTGDEPGQRSHELSSELADVYRLRQVNGLAQTTLRWDETAVRLPGWFLLEREVFRLDLEPKFLPPNRMRLRLLVSRVRNKAGDLERLLDTNLAATLDDPVVAGFSYGGQHLFLTLDVSRTRPRDGAPAAAVERARPRGPAVAPLPVRRVNPKVPEGVDLASLDGEVVLRVTIDESGEVKEVEILKSLRPEVDRETAEAVRQWAFEPGREKSGPGPTTFIMSFRYGAPRWESLELAPGGPFEDVPEAGPEGPAVQDAQAVEIGPILDSAADYCRRLSAAALDFTCEERITEDVYDYERTFDGSTGAYTAWKRLAKKIELLYDFQMVKTPAGVRESRTLLEENGKKTLQPNAPLLTKRFYSYRSLFGPVALFSGERRALYDYRLVGQDKVLGERAWVIEAKPKAGGPADALHGKAWVGQATGRILKIEVDAASLVGFEKLMGSYELSWQQPLLSTTHYYEFEKNGILFPSRTVFKEAFVVTGSQKRFQRSKAEIRFGNYRFFTVETETVIKD